MAWDPEGRNNNVKLYFRDVSRCKESGGRVLAGMSAGGGGWRWRLEVEAGGGGWRWRLEVEERDDPKMKYSGGSIERRP
jgi:hypothetical protein